jgi:hypothetical protein
MDLFMPCDYLVKPGPLMRLKTIRPAHAGRFSNAEDFLTSTRIQLFSAKPSIPPNLAKSAPFAKEPQQEAVGRT